MQQSNTTQAINNAIDKFVADGVLFRQTLAVFHVWLRQYDMEIVDVAPGVWRVIHLKDTTAKDVEFPTFPQALDYALKEASKRL